MRIRPGVDLGLQRALIDWSIAFLRNNGGRRIRTLVYVNDGSGLSLLREMGFTPGETGLDYTRAVDQAEIQTKIDERQAHGTLIKFGDWR
jgi:ribosomal protein S18 acetylase RimI-like enzyme